MFRKLLILIFLSLMIDVPYNFKRRPYQDALGAYMRQQTDLGRELGDRRAGKRAVICWHRRTGKDKTCLADHIFPAMFERVGAYHYYFPTAAEGRTILWEAMDRGGFPFMKHMPKRYIQNRNDHEMKIVTKNGSIFRILGTERMEYVGTNPVGCVFSEYSKQSPHWWELVSPILVENGGWAIFNFTPRGKNHAHRLIRMAQINPKWFGEILTVDDTHAVTPQQIQEERDSGMSEEMIQQEYYCSFNYGSEGAYYNKVVNMLYEQGRVTNDLKYDHGSGVYSICDPGYHWAWALFQVRGIEPVILRAGENMFGVDKYAEMLRDLNKKYGYRYLKHFAPIDTKTNNAYKAAPGSKTLMQHAAEHGLRFTILPHERRVVEGIERTRKFLYTCWFVADDCEVLLDALQAYCAKKIEKISTDYKPQFLNEPDKTWGNHLADVMRYMSMAWKRVMSINTGASLEDIHKWQVQYGLTG